MPPAKNAQPSKSRGRIAPEDDVAVKSLRSDLKQFTRQRLLDAALQCFKSRGYRETTVEAIADLAGTTVPTFYRHFLSKTELLYSLLGYLNEEVEATLTELDGMDVRDRRQVRIWLNSYMVMWGRLHRLCNAYWEAVNIDSTFSGRVLDDAKSCVSVMKNIMGRMNTKAQDRFSVRMGLMIMFMDRLALVVSVETRSARANELLDEFSKMLWLILNDDPALEKG